ncbi:MAG: acyl-CoA dehydratase activase-related protein [Eubacteriales bacterium]|nr:acyl-CoA dehydratase activase-related protein [Eubacteriales bacterium]
MSEMAEYRAGVDVGSTTVKVVVLDSENKIVYGAYRRHYAHVQETLAEMLSEAEECIHACSMRICITGSGSINLGKALGIGFVQEVMAVASAVRLVAPQTDVAIELGGEDAKIIYFRGSLEERMNGVCAGGTGSFIDQMAALLQTDAQGLNEAAASYQQIYPIAARCGVFAKTDIQPLINEGATKADLAASIFQAVVNQTISGLACGKPIRGCVAFLGGPLHFLPELKQAFIRTLRLTPENTVAPENSHLFAAMGAALETKDCEPKNMADLIETLRLGVSMGFEIKRLPPLFASKEEYEEFLRRHGKAVVGRTNLSEYTGDCFLGIDAGSTTTKMALIDTEGRLLFSYYANNQGNPVQTAIDAIRKLQEELPAAARIAYSCSTGYGEALLKAAFCLDEGEVETIAHCTAASFFEPEVDCVLDIGGQDMKCIKLRDHAVDTILLNEACSSGCGSFIENFAVSLGYTAEGFAKEALYAENPVDLGTRCTVFMNSNVKQAQKEGAPVSDISAGLAYSVIKNALFKVIKLADARALGKHIVVQGGSFCNHAVLRAFEKIAGIDAICPDISGVMGAFGAALIARERYHGQESSMLSIPEILNLTYTTSTARCGGCSNNCMLTISHFCSGKKYVSGNRCEKGEGSSGAKTRAPNVIAYKLERIFRYPPIPVEKANRGQIGIPRVLNMYENYPFWATFFKKLGFSVLLSPLSDRKLYERGMESIPSESECYPAKLAHGHVQWLIDQGAETIFHPCVFYEKQERPDVQNHYNCPIVVSYPENLKNNVEDIAEKNIRYIRPFIAFTSEKTAADRLVRVCRKEWNISEKEVRAAVHEAWEEQIRAKKDIVDAGERALAWMKKTKNRGIVLAGRPYHIDPEVNHGIPEMIASYGLAVLSEDSLPVGKLRLRSLRINDQWVYHSRLYSAAEYVSHRDDLELIQLNSFGCGLDAVTTDQVAEIMQNCNKLYTVLKIDEVNNLGAARIRLRSLLAAMKKREEQNIKSVPTPVRYKRTEFTKSMLDAGYTIIAPQMSPIHFDMLEPVFHKYGYNLVILDNDDRGAIDMGLQFVNNDACFPAITVVGQIMQAVLSGKFDTDKLAVIMTQTGGCCRASNYIGFIRRALDQVDMSHIPVISLNANGMEKNEGFKLPMKMLLDVCRGLVYGDLLMRCLYRMRPYEKEPGSANAMYKKWRAICIKALCDPNSKNRFARLCEKIVWDFDRLPIHEDLRKPRVGIVGEILVKYMPLANNHLVDLLEQEGAEAAVPDMMGFIAYCAHNVSYKRKYLGTGWKEATVARTIVKAIDVLRKPAIEALEKSCHFEAPASIEKLAELAKPFLSIGNQYGEGWFLTGEMVEFLLTDTPNIVCIQPFACLPNHVVGKGVIKVLKKSYPWANIVAVDYDPGASEVNQLNRIKLMLSSAKEACKA